MTLTERIATLEPATARHYARLEGVVRDIATEGITRHFDACDRHGIEPDRLAVREIIEDALNGRAVYKENVP